MSTTSSVGIIGAGPVARGLAEVLGKAGYFVRVSSRTPKPSGRSSGPAVVSFVEAAEADIIIFAVLHSASRGLAQLLAPQLAGKLVVDVDNAWRPGHYELAGLSESLTEGQWMANLLPEARVVRAFSHINWELFGRGLERPGYWGAGYAADDTRSIDEIEGLISDTGFVPVRVGTLAGSASIDLGGVLWSTLLQARHTEVLVQNAA